MAIAVISRINAFWPTDMIGMDCVWCSGAFETLLCGMEDQRWPLYLASEPCANKKTGTKRKPRGGRQIVISDR